MRRLSKANLRIYLYSLASATSSMIYNLFSAYAQFFYSDVVKISSHLVGRVWFVFGLWNSVNDPLTGRLSDRLRNRFGKRKPIITILIIPVILLFILIWSPLHSDSDTFKLINFLVVISVFDLLFSILDVNIKALLPEIYITIKDRARVASVQNMYIFFFAGFGLTLAPFIYEKYGWSTFAILFGLCGFVFYAISLLGIKEESSYSETNNSMFVAAKEILQNKDFLSLFSIQFSMRVALAIMLSVLPFYSKYVLLLEKGGTSLVMGSVLGASVLSIPIWEKVLLKIGSRKAIMLSFGLSAAFILLLLIPASIFIKVSIIATGAAIFSGTQSVATVMNTEVISNDFQRSKKNRSALIYGLLGMTNRFPPAVAGLLLGEVLAMSGYVPELSVSLQPDTVQLYLSLFFSLGIAISCLIALFFSSKYSEDLR